jgi:hypothetical protein
LKVHTPKSLMRGRAEAVGEGDIEFEDEIMNRVARRKRIVAERLPQARKNGRAATFERRAKTRQASGKPA